MPLRYYQSPEPQYIPRYIPTDSRLISQVDAHVQQQGMLGYQYEDDSIGELKRNASSQLQHLPDHLREEAIGLFDQSRERIDEHRERVGAARSLPAIQREVRELTESYQPYAHRSQEIGNVKERIQNAEAPEPYKS